MLHGVVPIDAIANFIDTHSEIHMAGFPDFPGNSSRRGVTTLAVAVNGRCASA